MRFVSSKDDRHRWNQAQPHSLQMPLRETPMPRKPKSHQFDLFASRGGDEGRKTPSWRMLPAATRQTIMTLMTRLILDCADGESVVDRREAAHDDV